MGHPVNWHLVGGYWLLVWLGATVDCLTRERAWWALSAPVWLRDYSLDGSVFHGSIVAR